MKKPNSVIILEKLRKGEKVECPECQKGKLVTDYDYTISHYFYCDNPNCDCSLIVD